ncbi:hypothetical protein LTR27_005753 [Elasticomyces elasticus]|nr:hypothetical protein LTR27_005753 [Elasticomyces elasticus]
MVNASEAMDAHSALLAQGPGQTINLGKSLLGRKHELESAGIAPTPQKYTASTTSIPDAQDGDVGGIEPRSRKLKRESRRSGSGGQAVQDKVSRLREQIDIPEFSSTAPSPEYYQRNRKKPGAEGYTKPKVIVAKKSVSFPDPVAQTFADHGTGTGNALRLRYASTRRKATPFDQDSDDSDDSLHAVAPLQKRSFMPPHSTRYAQVDATSLYGSNSDDVMQGERTTTTTSKRQSALQTAAVAVNLNVDTRKSIGKAKPRKGLRQIRGTASTRDATPPPTRITLEAVIDLTGDSEGTASPPPNYVHAEDRSASVGLSIQRKSNVVAESHGGTSVALAKRTLTRAIAIKQPRKKPFLMVKKEIVEARTAEPNRWYRKVECTAYIDQQNELVQLRKANAEMTAIIANARTGDRIQAQHEANKVERERVRLEADVCKMLGLQEELDIRERMLCTDRMALEMKNEGEKQQAITKENVETWQEVVSGTRGSLQTAMQVLARAVKYQPKYEGGLGLM